MGRASAAAMVLLVAGELHCPQPGGISRSRTTPAAAVCPIAFSHRYATTSAPGWPRWLMRRLWLVALVLLPPPSAHGRVVVHLAGHKHARDVESRRQHTTRLAQAPARKPQCRTERSSAPPNASRAPAAKDPGLLQFAATRWRVEGTYEYAYPLAPNLVYLLPPDGWPPYKQPVTVVSRDGQIVSLITNPQFSFANPRPVSSQVMAGICLYPRGTRRAPVPCLWNRFLNVITKWPFKLVARNASATGTPWAQARALMHHDAQFNPTAQAWMVMVTHLVRHNGTMVAQDALLMVDDKGGVTWDWAFLDHVPLVMERAFPRSRDHTRDIRQRFPELKHWGTVVDYTHINSVYWDHDAQEVLPPPRPLTYQAICQAARGRALAGKRLMGTATYGGRGYEKDKGKARGRQQSIQASCPRGWGGGGFLSVLFFSTLAKGAQHRTFRFVISLDLFLAVHAVACTICFNFHSGRVGGLPPGPPLSPPPQLKCT